MIIIHFFAELYNYTKLYLMKSQNLTIFDWILIALVAGVILFIITLIVKLIIRILKYITNKMNKYSKEKYFLHIELKELSMTCQVSPTQWEGKTNANKYVYIRYRWGYLKVHIAETVIEWEQGIFTTLLDKKIGKNYSGFLDTETMLKITNIKLIT